MTEFLRTTPFCRHALVSFFFCPNRSFCTDSTAQLSTVHSEIDSLVTSVHQNLVNYLKLSKVPEPSSQITSLSQHQTLANNMNMRVTAENLISTCNQLLLMTNKLKKMLLISDYQEINKEVVEQTTKRLDKIDAEVGALQEKLDSAENLKEVLKT